MSNFKRNIVKQISLVIAVVFFISNISYGYPVNKDRLRIPVGSAGSRMQQVLRLSYTTIDRMESGDKEQLRKALLLEADELSRPGSLSRDSHGAVARHIRKVLEDAEKTMSKGQDNIVPSLSLSGDALRELQGLTPWAEPEWIKKGYNLGVYRLTQLIEIFSRTERYTAPFGSSLRFRRGIGL